MWRAIKHTNNHLGAGGYCVENATTITSLSTLRTVELGCIESGLRSSTVSRLRHLAITLTMILGSHLSAAVVACDRHIIVLMPCVVLTQAWRTFPMIRFSILRIDRNTKPRNQTAMNNDVVLLTMVWLYRSLKLYTVLKIFGFGEKCYR